MAVVEMEKDGPDIKFQSVFKETVSPSVGSPVICVIPDCKNLSQYPVPAVN